MPKESFVLMLPCTEKPAEPHTDLKGQYHEIFCFRFFSGIIFPQTPENNTRVSLNFFKNSRRYSQVKVHHGINDKGGKFATGGVNTSSTSANCTVPAANLPPVLRYQWQTKGTISDSWQIKVNLKEKIIYLLNLLPKGVQKKYWKLFWWKIFSFATGAPCAANISANFRKITKTP